MERINWIEFKEKANPILDAYRKMRANLQSAMKAKNIKLIEFTSATSGTDVNAVVAGLAIVLAQAGYKTLVVDGNLEEPSQHVLFSLPNQGISEAVLAGTDLHQMVQNCVEQKNLFILTAGVVAENPGEILLSDSVQKFLIIARDEYDYILLDMPPIDQGAGAIVMSSKMDGIVMVITCGKDKVNLVNEAKIKLAQASGVVLGCILDKKK